MDDQTRTALGAAVQAALGPRAALRGARPRAGGCIHAAWEVDTNRAMLFVKLNKERFAGTFAAEADGLAALAAAGMRVPGVLAQGIAGTLAFLALEWLALSPRGDDAALGSALARLHRDTGPCYGWAQDNALGTTAQRNTWHADWMTFWRDCRLAPLMAKTESEDPRMRGLFAAVREALPELLAGHAPGASLLHGDLWRGNVGFLPDGSPAVFDPAVYRGDREADLAMTELFGGFPRLFYTAYEATWPPLPGQDRRRDLYNLYHLLNHLHLFGETYREPVCTCAERLLRRAS